MLSASIQMSASQSSSASQSPSTNAAAVTENAAGSFAGKSGAAGQNGALQTNSLEPSQDEVFSGELNAALVNAESLTAEAASEELSADLPGENLDQAGNPDDQDAQQQPDAEEWLLAMLNQQQLQLQTKDTSASGTIPLGVKTGAAMAPVAQQVSLVSAENLFGKNREDLIVSAGNLEKPDAAKNVNAQLNVKSLSAFANTTNVNPVVAQALAVNEMRAADTANNSVSTNSSAAINSINTNFLQPALAETGVSESLTFSPASTAASGTDAAQRMQTQLQLQAPEAKWGEQLLHALRDNVQVQIQQKIQNATIRLDPPELGSLEIFLSHESGRLTVQITSSQADVARLIQATSDRLRQELSGPQFTQVNIQTSAEGQGSQQQSRERQSFLSDETILANEQPFVGDDAATKRTSDVLVTV